MRPFAVLILILGALAALIFALLSITASGGRGEGTVSASGPVVRPAEVTLRDEPSLVTPEEIPPPAGSLSPQRSEREVVSVASPEGQGAYLGFLAGLVVDPTGKPVPEAEVSLYDAVSGASAFSDALRLMNDGPLPKARSTARTDAQGRFRFTSLEPGEWSLIVTHKRFAREEVAGIPVPETGGHEERIKLQYGNGFYGFVVDARTGQGIAGATLTLDNPMAAFLPKARKAKGQAQEVVTNENGAFEFHNIGGGQKTLLVAAEGFATQIHNNFAMLLQAENQEQEGALIWNNQTPAENRLKAQQPKEPKQKTFELEPEKTLAGRVLGPNREGIAGIEIEAIFQAGTVGSRGVAASSTGGEFLIDGLADGLYTVRVLNAPGYQSTPLQRVEAGRTDLELVLAEQGSVRGTVVDAATGRPIPRFSCAVRTVHPRNPTWGSVVSKKNVSSKDGRFHLTGVNEGQYVVEAFVSDKYPSSFSEPFQVTQGIETSDIVVRLTKGGKITGVVVSSYTGEPIAGAEVRTNDNNYVESEFMDLLGALSQTATTKKSTRTDESGRFELDLLTPDDYQVLIKKAGFTSLVVNNVKVGDSLETELGSLSLSEGAVIRGIVYDSLGEPLSGATVLLNPSDNSRMWGSRRARTDISGRFSITNAEAGEYKLNAARPASAHNNPFGPVVDMRNSEITVTVDDGGEYDFELRLK